MTHQEYQKAKKQILDECDLKIKKLKQIKK